MKKSNKGFTLVELLAVIVVLGIIMTVAGSAVLGQRKRANQKEVESIYNSIKAFGPDIYLNEKEKLMTDKVYFNATYLKNKGYLKVDTIKNPSNSKEDCKVYLLIDKSSNNNMFEAYVNCEGLDAKGPAEGINGYSEFSEE